MQPRLSKRRLLGVLCAAVSGLLVYWLLARIDLERAAAVLRHTRWSWLAVALVATCLIPLCSVWRWMGVLRAQQDLKLGFTAALRAVLMANVLNSFLPSKAGDGAKALYLRKHGGVFRGIGTVVLERAVDFAVLGTLGVVGSTASGALWGLVTGVVLLAMVVALFVAVLFIPLRLLPLSGRIRQQVSALTGVFRCWVRMPRAVAQTVLASFGTWSLAGLTVCCLTSALDTGLSWGYAYGVFPLAILAGLVPVTVSGVGTRDSAFVMLLSTRIPVEEATLVALGYTLFAYWLLSLLSLPVVAWELLEFFRHHRDVPTKEVLSSPGKG